MCVKTVHQKNLITLVTQYLLFLLLEQQPYYLIVSRFAKVIRFSD